ncbi:UNVERIFIED_CONTAM: hypothetical protein GTU68_037083 [Idotea baltica]|nr:hypothetical protein [Idotea baltica]
MNSGLREAFGQKYLTFKTKNLQQ